MSQWHVPAALEMGANHLVQILNCRMCLLFCASWGRYCNRYVRLAESNQLCTLHKLSAKRSSIFRDTFSRIFDGSIMIFRRSRMNTTFDIMIRVYSHRLNVHFGVIVAGTELASLRHPISTAISRSSPCPSIPSSTSSSTCLAPI